MDPKNKVSTLPSVIPRYALRSRGRIETPGKLRTSLSSSARSKSLDRDVGIAGNESLDSPSHGGFDYYTEQLIDKISQLSVREGEGPGPEPPGAFTNEPPAEPEVGIPEDLKEPIEGQPIDLLGNEVSNAVGEGTVFVEVTHQEYNPDEETVESSGRDDSNRSDEGDVSSEGENEPLNLTGESSVELL